MSHKLYASGAERQRAFRARQRTGSPSTASSSRVLAKTPSRPTRILRLVAEVRTLSAEYQNWLDRLPSNFADGQRAAEIEEVIAQLDEACAILEAIDPPAVGRT